MRGTKIPPFFVVKDTFDRLRIFKDSLVSLH